MAGSVDPTPFNVSLGYLVLAIAHLFLDRRLALHYLKRRGLERSKDEYPFEPPTFEFWPKASLFGVVAFLVREVCFGWVRVLVVAVMVLFLSHRTCGETRYFAFLLMAVSTASVVFLASLRAFVDIGTRRKVWAALFFKHDLLTGQVSTVAVSRGTHLLTNMVRSALYLQVYQGILGTLYLVFWASHIDSCPTAMAAALRGVLIFQIVAGPALLLFGQVFVAAQLARAPLPQGYSLAHLLFFYFPSDVEKRRGSLKPGFAQGGTSAGQFSELELRVISTPEMQVAAQTRRLPSLDLPSVSSPELVGMTSDDTFMGRGFGTGRRV